PTRDGSSAGEFMSREELKKRHEFNEKDLVEPFLATYLDVAVLRCLFTSQWIEEGIEWALSYLHRRLETISKYKEKRKVALFRSASLPIPRRKAEERTVERVAEAAAAAAATKAKAVCSKEAESSEGGLKTTGPFREARRSSFS